MSTWVSHDYASGDNKSRPWIKCIPRKPIRCNEVNMIGRFGGMEYDFDKASYKFTLGKTFPTQENGFRMSCYRTHEISKKHCKK